MDIKMLTLHDRARRLSEPSGPLCVEQLLLYCERSQQRRFGLTWQEKPLLGVEVAKTEWRETTGEDTR